MIPLIGGVKELENQKKIVVEIADEVLAKAGMKDQKYLVGTMIEIPRAALTADTVANEAEFFSFGTNHLTQTGMGIGIGGEHGGEPSSVQFCYRVGMNYVSCSPYRVPIARLAAAQAAISGDKSESQRTA
jgi:pyruvate,orthophosphate dikinase